MSTGSHSPQSATMPPFMPPPFMDPMITDEQHIPAPFPAFVEGDADPTGQASVSVFDPRLEPIPTNRHQDHRQSLQDLQTTAGNNEQLDLGQNGDGDGEKLIDTGVGTGVKRALRACSNCRKDKTKCDGARPCSNCVKKGFKEVECVDGCVHCRKMRLRCLGGRPCVNCSEAGTECIEEREGERRTGPPLNRNVNILDFSSTVSSVHANSTKLKVNGEGKQKKQRPTLALNFSAPPVSLDAVPSSLYGTSSSTRPEGQGMTVIQNPDGTVVQVPLYISPPPPHALPPNQDAGPSDLSAFAHPQLKPPSRSRAGALDRAKTACRACRRDNKKCSNNRPCDRCIQRGEKCLEIEKRSGEPERVKMRCRACRRDNKKCEEMSKRPCEHCRSIGETCEEVPRKGRGSGSRVKVACMGCRRDKIQCEEGRPCRNCLRKGIRCLERLCPTCNGTGDGDGAGGRCAVCKGKSTSSSEGKDMNLGDVQVLNGHDILYSNIAAQVQGPDHHQMIPHHTQNLEQMHLVMMNGHHRPPFPQLPPPLPSPEQAQAYHQMMLAHQHVNSSHASLNHTPVQTPTHSRPPSPRRNISSVRFDGELQHHHPPSMHLAQVQNQT